MEFKSVEDELRYAKFVGFYNGLYTCVAISFLIWFFEVDIKFVPITISIIFTFVYVAKFFVGVGKKKESSDVRIG